MTMTSYTSDLSAVLGELHRRGVSIRVDGPNLQLRPKSRIPRELLPVIRELKPEIMATLKRGYTNPTAASIIQYFSRTDQKAYWRRVIVLDYHGYDRWTAELLAVGELPRHVDQWPAAARQRLEALRAAGCSKCEAEDRVRIEFRLAFTN